MIWKWHASGCNLYLSSRQIKVLILDMSRIWGNIYDRSIDIVFGTVFVSTFLSLWKIVFLQKIFQNLIYMFSLYPKNSRTGSRKNTLTQEWLVVESCPTPYWVMFLIICRLVYDISSHLSCLMFSSSPSLQLLQRASH